MSDIAAPRTLADQALGRSKTLTDILLVAGGAALVGVAAQLYVPLWPVPITGQTLAVLIVGSSLGAARGTLALVAYAALGVLGVPWFSEGASGWGVLVGPTGGYILGFIAAAALTGWLAQRRWDRTFVRATATFAAGTALPFVIGIPWLALTLDLDLSQSLESGLYPFIIGGVVKAAVAAAAIPALWALARRRSH